MVYLRPTHLLDLWTWRLNSLPKISTKKIPHYLTPLRIGTTKTTEDDKCWQGGWRECKMVRSLLKTIWWFLTKIQIEELPYNPATPLLGTQLKELKARSWRNIYIPMFVVLLTTAESRSNPTVPWTVQWINKMWLAHTMEYLSALRRKKILTHATSWMNLEDIMLSEISQKDKYSYEVSNPTLWGL